MKDLMSLLKQWSSLLLASIATACCLGMPAILAAIAAAGLGFIIKDAYLFPIFLAAIAVTLKALYHASQAHGKMLPCTLGVLGGAVSTISLWLLITGTYSIPWLIYAGLALLLLASIWDFINGRFFPCKTKRRSKREISKSIRKRRIIKIIIYTAAAIVLYGLYKYLNT